MNLITGIESTDLFGGEVPAGVLQLIERTRRGSDDDVAAVLWTAILSYPRCLPPYYLLYKFHANRGELGEAQKVATRALAVAAWGASISTDWCAVQPGDADFSIPGPPRFWLFTLKALAFISVRRGERALALKLIAKLRWLDPIDCIGFEVVEALLAQSENGNRKLTN
ncbi:hypothetical protein EVC45_41745 [Paraburkholderia sp. UYCP14C]|uniref:hypothetical protein n=1 Tax=Paraburkholderia sp. UYCP14C TaxID=2511130 RepID=UPI00102130DE|nr:hypothetical protein [Paraburkholderia sp. UYCP14C]RZF23885.1 hypothetical protein EVC45_41745 [Paraburkholderia sp. UYCP14C]